MKKLIAAGNELNEVLLETPEIEIDPKKTDEAKLKSQILEAAKLLTDEDELSEETTAVIEALKAENKPPRKSGESTPAPEPDPEDDDEDDDEPEQTLEDLVKESDYTALMAMSKEYPEFAKIKAALAGFKPAKVEDMRNTMLKFLKGKQAPATGADAKSGKPESKTPAEKKEKKAPAPKKAAYTRIDAVMESLAGNPKTQKEWSTKANELMIANGGKANDTENATIMKFATKVLSHVENHGFVIPQ